MSPLERMQWVAGPVCVSVVGNGFWSRLAGFPGCCVAQWQGVSFTYSLRSGPEGPEGGGRSWRQAALGLPLVSNVGQST